MEKTMITIRKYQNRKLYLTNESRYVNLTEIERLVKSGNEIQVIDSLGNDITGQTLLQVVANNPKNVKNLVMIKDIIRVDALQLV